MPGPKKDLSQLCLHSITTKPWSLEEALDKYCEKGIGGISVWQNAIEKQGAKKAGKLLESYPIEVVSYVRGGFFPATSRRKRQKAIDHNKQLLEEASLIKAPLLVLVVGADPGQSLNKSRKQIQEGIEAILPMARSLGVKLGIEPLHPMYAHSRSAINTLQQANDMAESIKDAFVGLVVDVYHLWWEENLKKEIARCGKNENLFAYHISDWKAPLQDILNDRGLMGEGCIPLKKIKRWIGKAGFKGYHEVEIFSNRFWAMDQDRFLKKIIDHYIQYA